jgi:hypothetical protein
MADGGLLLIHTVDNYHHIAGNGKAQPFGTTDVE